MLEPTTNPPVAAVMTWLPIVTGAPPTDSVVDPMTTKAVLELTGWAVKVTEPAVNVTAAGAAGVAATDTAAGIATVELPTTT